jgi:hypothetical protein
MSSLSNRDILPQPSFLLHTHLAGRPLLFLHLCLETLSRPGAPPIRGSRGWKNLRSSMLSDWWQHPHPLESPHPSCPARGQRGRGYHHEDHRSCHRY